MVESLVDWRAIRFESPCGRWYLVHDEVDRKKFAVKGKDGELRVVLSRDELLAMERGVARELTIDEKKIVSQQMLHDLMIVKGEFPNAKLLSLNAKKS